MPQQKEGESLTFRRITRTHNTRMGLYFTDLPVEDLGLDLAVEAVQGDVVLHERLHLELVREVEWGTETASLRDCEPNDAASGTKLKSF